MRQSATSPVHGSAISNTEQGAEGSASFVELTIDGRAVLIDAADLPLVVTYNWRIEQRDRRAYVQATRRYGRETVRLHRLLLGNPDGVIDHINSNGLDNRRANLRVCTTKENCRNKRKKIGSLTKYKGVTSSKRKANPWRAFIKVDGRDYHLGQFPTEVDAAKAYDAAARKHFGEYAAPNFSES